MIQYFTADYYESLAADLTVGAWRRLRQGREQKQLDKLVSRAMRRTLTCEIERAFERTDAYVWLLKAADGKSVTQETGRIQAAVADALGRKNFEQKVVVCTDPLRVEVQKLHPDKVKLTDFVKGLSKLCRNQFTFAPGVRQLVSKHTTHTMSLADAEVAQILIAGATGSGKTQLAISIATTLALLNDPEQLSMLIIDPKRVDIGNTDLRRLPHLAHPVITDPGLGVTAIYRLATEMKRRLDEIDACSRANRRWMMPGRIFCYVDELADLIENDAQVERALTWIAAQGRGLGIHLCLATQRPTVDIVTGHLRSNLPCRFGGWVRGADDSRIVTGLPSSGLEDLQGSGMFKLFLRSVGVNLQGFYVDLDSDLPSLVDRVAPGKPAWSISNLTDTEDMPEVVAELVKEETASPDALFAEALERTRAGETLGLNELDRMRQRIENKTLGRKQARELLARIKEVLNAPETS